jgi:hypothetical protein
MTLTFTVRPLLKAEHLLCSGSSLHWKFGAVKREWRRAEKDESSGAGHRGCGMLRLGGGSHLPGLEQFGFEMVRDTQLYQLRLIFRVRWSISIAYFLLSTTPTCSSSNLEYTVLQKLWFKIRMWAQTQFVEQVLRNYSLKTSPGFNQSDLCF